MVVNFWSMILYWAWQIYIVSLNSIADNSNITGFSRVSTGCSKV